MRKRSIFCLLLALLVALGSFTFSAMAQEQRVFDDANLMGSSEKEKLEAAIQDFRDQHNMDLVVMTIDDAEGKSSQAFADDYYDYNGFGQGEDNSGALLLIDMDHRQATISTTGWMIDYLSDARIESILDDVVYYLKEQDYGNAAFSFVERSGAYVEEGYPQNAYRYDTETGEVTKPVIARQRKIAWYEWIISALIAAGIGAIACVSVAQSYKMKRARKAASSSYRSNSVLRLADQQDHLIDTRVTSIHIPRSDHSDGGGGFSGGGGSSTHSSSSGTSHGGGSRGF